MRPSLRPPCAGRGVDREDGRVTRDLALLPKGHLHLHFEATIRPLTLRDFASEADEPVPSWADFPDFSDFQDAYGEVLALIRRPEQLERIMTELADDAKADGVVYVEVTLAPVLHAAPLRRRRGGGARLPPRRREARGGADRRRHPGDDRLRPRSCRSSSRSRTRGSPPSTPAAASSPTASTPTSAARPPRRSRRRSTSPAQAGLLITPHAGELVGPESVREAVEVLHADRILHGVRVIEDPELVAEVARLGDHARRLPSSNVVLHVVPDLEHHPLPALLAAGVSCSINADDPIQFGPNVGEEYELARTRLGLTDEQLAGLRPRLHHRLRRPGARQGAGAGRHRRLALRRVGVSRRRAEERLHDGAAEEGGDRRHREAAEAAADPSPSRARSARRGRRRHPHRGHRAERHLRRRTVVRDESHGPVAHRSRPATQRRAGERREARRDVQTVSSVIRTPSRADPRPPPARAAASRGRPAGTPAPPRRTPRRR